MKLKKDLEAIHQQDLVTLLENFGLMDDFKMKKIKCNFCNNIISEINFGAIFSKNKKIFFSCSKLDCLSKLSSEK